MSNQNKSVIFYWQPAKYSGLLFVVSILLLIVVLTQIKLTLLSITLVICGLVLAALEFYLMSEQVLGLSYGRAAINKPNNSSLSNHSCTSNPVKAEANRANTWRIKTKKGEWQPVVIHPRTVVTHKLIVLMYRTEYQWLTRVIWLWPAMMTAEQHRTLRVMLRFARY